MVEKLLQHKHCRICDKAIPVDEETCSEECKTKLEALIKKRRTNVYIIWGLLIVVVVVFVILPMFGAG